MLSNTRKGSVVPAPVWARRPTSVDLWVMTVIGYTKLITSLSTTKWVWLRWLGRREYGVVVDVLRVLLLLI